MKTWAIIFIVLLSTACASLPSYDALRFEAIGPFTATLSWTSETAQRFVIEYGEGDLLDRQIEEKEKSARHQMTLTGLKPATRYGYRLHKHDRLKYFRTAPGKDGVFDLIVLSDDSPACGDQGLFATAPPDIIVNLAPRQCPLADKASSVLIKEMPGEAVSRFNYGRYEILLAADTASLTRALAERPPTAETPVLAICSVIPEYDAQRDENALYVSGRTYRYRDGAMKLTEHQTMWLEIDAFEAALVRGMGLERTRDVIIAAPPETKKSCLFCNRLLEAGRYMESLEWYRAFIRENEERHAVEDAYYSIARILDEKLFNYPQAIAAYNDFMVRYPDSRRVILIKYRLAYLAAHADNEYFPLRRFEQAKSALVRDNALPTVTEVEKLVDAFPQTAVAEEALYWLGHVLESTDIARAQGHYQTLIDRFPQSENAAMAAIALGDIRYRDKQYRQAVVAYEKALAVVPPSFHLSVQDKLRKSTRNIAREYVRYAAWIVLGAWLLLTIIRRAVPSKRDWLIAFIILTMFACVGGLFFFWTYERTNNLLPLVAAMAGGTSVVVLWNRALAGRIKRGRVVLVMAHALTVPPAMLFLLLYHFHQLYVFGM